MEAFHSFWSEPGLCRNRGELRFPDYEQLTAILSALEWRGHSGKIRMVTDSAGMTFFQNAGLTPFWDEICVELDQLKYQVNPIAFWAAGKLAALRTISAPCVMLDTDLIVWENVESMLRDDAVAAHPEVLNPRTYPPPGMFQLLNGYHFPQNWDFSLPAANTAFLFVGDNKLRDSYLDAAFSFMRNVETAGMNPVQTMCFAEQRILPLCAEAEGRTLSWLMRPEEISKQKLVTHSWGFKQVLRLNDQIRRSFCMRCVRRIVQNHPKESELLDGCRELQGYYREYMKNAEN